MLTFLRYLPSLLGLAAGSLVYTGVVHGSPDIVEAGCISLLGTLAYAFLTRKGRVSLYLDYMDYHFPWVLGALMVSLIYSLIIQHEGKRIVETAGVFAATSIIVLSFLYALGRFKAWKRVPQS